MKRQTFEKANEAAWVELEQTVQTLEKRTPSPNTAKLPQLFRQVCGDLALAQHRMFGRKLCERLNNLVIEIGRAHV